MTGMTDEKFEMIRSRFNQEIREDFYRRHRLQKYLEFLDLHIIDYKNAFHRLKWIYIPQIIEGLYNILIKRKLHRFQDYIIAILSDRLPEAWKERFKKIGSFLMPRLRNHKNDLS